MTRNQIRAVHIARALVAGTGSPDTLADADWHLLLLAAGVTRNDTSWRAVAQQVIEAAGQQRGYFWPGDRERSELARVVGFEPALLAGPSGAEATPPVAA